MYSIQYKQPFNDASLIAIFTTSRQSFKFLDPNLMFCGRKSRKEGAETASTSCFLQSAFSDSPLLPVKLPRCNGWPASLNHIKPQKQEASLHCYYWDKDPSFTACTIVILHTINLCLHLQCRPRKLWLLLLLWSWKRRQKAIKSQFIF